MHVLLMSVPTVYGRRDVVTRGRVHAVMPPLLLTYTIVAFDVCSSYIHLASFIAACGQRERGVVAPGRRDAVTPPRRPCGAVC